MFYDVKHGKTNGEYLFEDNPELLLDTMCGFDCDRCACKNDCPEDVTYYSDACKIFKMEWLSDWYEWPYKKEEKQKVAGNSRKKSVRCVETGVVYDSCTNASKETGINKTCINDVCRGKQKTAGGFHWEYA